MDWSEMRKLPQVGIEEHDREHQEILETIDAMRNTIRSKGTNAVKRRVIRAALESIVTHMRDHFATEETLMRQSAYPDYVAHKREHETFMKTVGELQGKMTTTSMMPSVESLNVLREWLYHHILESDKPIVPHLIETALSQKAASVMPLQGGNGLVSRTGLQG